MVLIKMREVAESYLGK